MTLTVRLDPALEAALARYCAATGATKSLVVQESLASYLLADQTTAANKQPRGARAAPSSDNYKAFEAAGLVGAVALGKGADKAAVRALVAHRFAQRRVRRGGE